MEQNKKAAAEAQAKVERDVAARSISLDIMSAERYGAVELLKQAHKEFPLREAGMPADFKGTHYFALNSDGFLVLHVWWAGKSWPLTFTGSLEQPPRTTLPPNFPPVEAILQK